MVLFIFSVVFALGISGMCSLLEATLLSLRPAQVAQMSQKRPVLGAIWQRFQANIERPIAVILIINTTSHTIGATVAGSQFKTISTDPRHMLIFSIVFTFLMLQASEILPKTIGVQQSTRIAPLVALPLEWLTKLFAPALYVIHLLNRPFERKTTGAERPATLEEIAALAAMARMSKLIGRQQEQIITGASELSDLTAGEVMLPMDQVATLSTTQSLDEAMAVASQDPHTRFPIRGAGDPGEILGYINFKELAFLRQDPADESKLEPIIRPLHFVAADQPTAQLLRAFVEDHVHMAIVRGADGTALGLVTLEDIVEELVGELEDEFDRLPRQCHKLRSGAWRVGGGLPMEAVASRLGIEVEGQGQNLSAWLIDKIGGEPKSGARHEAGGVTFTVRRTRRGKISEVSVRPAAE